MNPLIKGLEFNWKDLHGKTLEFFVQSEGTYEEDGEVIVVMGYEKATGHYYVIHTEVNRK